MVSVGPNFPKIQKFLLVLRRHFLIVGPSNQSNRITSTNPNEQMFDGNHRVRRSQNLGGGGGRRPRGRRTIGSSAPSSATAGGPSSAPSSRLGLARTTTTTNSLSLTAVPSSKSQLLEAARVQREQRRLLSRKNGAAVHWQRLYWGWRCRRSLIAGSDDGSLMKRYEDLVASLPNTSTNIIASENTMMQLASVLSMLLSPALLPLVVRQQRPATTSAKAGRSNTVEVATELILPLATAVASSNCPQNCNEYVAGRIVGRCLFILQSMEAASSSAKAKSAFSGDQSLETQSMALVELVASLLGCHRDGSSAAGPTGGSNASFAAAAAAATKMDHVLSMALFPESITDGKTLLFLCFRGWFDRSTGSTSAPSKSTTVTRVALVLLRLSTQAAAASVDGRAILAAALLASSSPHRQLSPDWSTEMDRCVAAMTQTSDRDGGYMELFSSLIGALVGRSVLLEDASACATSSTVDATTNLTSAVQSMVAGKELTLLINALDHIAPELDPEKTSSTSKCLSISSSILIVHLLHYVMDRRQDLAIVASLYARGEDIRSILANNNAADIIDLTAGEEGGGNGDGDGDDGSSSDSDEDMEEDVPGPQQPLQAVGSGVQSTLRAASRSGSRYSRQDLQTTGKLDRLYCAEIGNARKEALIRLKETSQTSDADLLLMLAKWIGGRYFMKSIAISLFSFDERPADTAALRMAWPVYSTVLSLLLQCMSGFKTRNSSVTSPLLSSLSFSNDFLRSLWSVVASSSRGGLGIYTGPGSVASAASLVTFCDVYSHHLLAIDDDDFLRNHTVSGDRESAGGIIDAKDLVSHLSRCLYEIYWSKPVTKNDVSVPSRIASGSGEDLFQCHRLRLLLSGTKLWNALHVRWCRLRSSPFCDEQAWLFPNLVTMGRDDDAVTIAGISSSAVAAHDDDLSMSDNDSEASPMDVDGDADAASQEPTAAETENDALASAFSDPKMARVLTAIPQALPFDRRVKMFTSLLTADKARTQDETQAFRQAAMAMMDQDEEWEFSGRVQAEVRREELYADSMKQLNKLGRKLRRRVQITMINKHGQTEAGIDGGGVFKEFLDDLIKEAFLGTVPVYVPSESYKIGQRIRKRFQVQKPLFVVTPTQSLAVNTAITKDRQFLEHYEFLGRVLGKAVYEQILVEPQFCLPFLNQLLGKQNTLDDLNSLDPEIFRHLMSLKRMSSQDIASMGLTFELTRDDESQTTVELIPGGSSVPVTRENAIKYVHLVAHHKLNLETAAQTHAFLRGFRDLIPASWVRLFSSYELQKIISGDDSVQGIDVAGLKRVMAYAGGYHPSQPIMQWFWEVLESFTPRQQQDFLKFMTSCSRQPLLGFQALVPVPCVQQIRLREEEGGDGNQSGNARLPTSSTCMNLLKLPKYSSKEMLRDKLLYAIEAGAGFELS